MPKKQPVEIVAILDRSGSMESIKQEAINGYNHFLETQQKETESAHLTLVLFDHEYFLVENSTPIQSASPLSEKTFEPRGTTALHDAIGRTLTTLLDKNPKRAVICILTDGQENASQEFKLPKVKELIKRCESKGWMVCYLAANQDAFAVGGQMGVKMTNTVNFAADKGGVQLAYDNMRAMTTAYCNTQATN